MPGHNASPADVAGLSSSPVVAAYGGGLNSTAMLLRWVTEGLPLKLILFADTGAERPATYDQVAKMSRWLVSRGAPPIVTVRYATREGKVITLEERCLQTKRLPSLAYGFKKCSLKFKRQPQDKYVREWAPAQEAWNDGRKVIKLIGYDADEPHRAERAKAKYALDLKSPKPSLDARRYQYLYPLTDIWDMGRDECRDLCASFGFCDVPKSSCIFCPSTSNAEIFRMHDTEPELLRRCLAIEANAESTTAGRGLGGQNRRWADIIKQPRLFTDQSPPVACDCYDGGWDD